MNLKPLDEEETADEEQRVLRTAKDLSACQRHRTSPSCSLGYSLKREKKKKRKRCRRLGAGEGSLSLLMDMEEGRSGKGKRPRSDMGEAREMQVDVQGVTEQLQALTVEETLKWIKFEDWNKSWRVYYHERTGCSMELITAIHNKLRSDVAVTDIVLVVNGNEVEADDAMLVSELLPSPCGDEKDTPIIARLRQEVKSYRISEVPQHDATFGLTTKLWEFQVREEPCKENDFDPPTVGDEDAVVEYMQDKLLPKVFDQLHSAGSDCWAQADVRKSKCELEKDVNAVPPHGLRGTPGDICIVPKEYVWFHDNKRRLALPVQDVLKSMSVVIEVKAPGTDLPQELGQVRAEVVLVRRHLAGQGDHRVIGLLTKGKECIMTELVNNRVWQERPLLLHQAANFLIDFLTKEVPFKGAGEEDRDDELDDEEDFEGKDDFKRVVLESRAKTCVARMFEGFQTGRIRLPSGWELTPLSKTEGEKRGACAND
ncbi:unnamed protein product [Vitrella brassicaformis CCMP3155]|uniref:Uncharacterized protein n=2 Tax=Vitrella brassicaformis TaxID=1169539 RepID=A0A0G4FDZ4_VITBC|nr:unnamed protein product [Vitrella brassicaformis CCMP3155]|eukprot:CEM11395.1 unnamed protein product [Vitrella brassicaformis CCMP3155]